MVKINVDQYYSKTELYPYIPSAVFDALEAAYLDGVEYAEVPRYQFAAMKSNLNAAGICLRQ